MQVIVDNEIILKRWSKNSVRIYKKNILLALFFVTLLWFVTPKMMTKYLYFFFIFFLKKYKKNTFYKVNLNPSVWRFWIWKIVHCIFFSQNFCKSFLLLFLCISTFLWNLQFLKLQKHSFRKITIYKNSRHTIQYYISWKKGTFDFINPHFTNSYHKNSSNSTDFH